MHENFNSDALTIKFLQQTRNFCLPLIEKRQIHQLLAPRKFHGLQYTASINKMRHNGKIWLQLRIVAGLDDT
jgi:hypothetical protein